MVSSLGLLSWGVGAGWLLSFLTCWGWRLCLLLCSYCFVNLLYLHLEVGHLLYLVPHLVPGVVDFTALLGLVYFILYEVCLLEILQGTAWHGL